MTDGEEVRNSIDGSEVANAVQAGSIGSLHIGGAARENHLRDSYRAAHATFLAIAEAASGITWRDESSARRQCETLAAHCSSLDDLVSDFDLFAPAEVRSAFHRARSTAVSILADARLRLTLTRLPPQLFDAISRRGLQLADAMRDTTTGFVEAVRTSAH